MRDQLIKFVRNISDGVWLSAFILLGTVLGLSLEPLHWPDGATALTSDLKLLGWLVVAVLCSSTGAMVWLTFEREPPDAKAGNTHMLESQMPISQALEPSSGRLEQPETGVETCAPPVSAVSGQTESPASESPPAPETPPQQIPPQPANDPFLAALDYLGHTQATVRVGGILAIERVARSSKNSADLTACAGTLAAYIQQYAAQDRLPKSHPAFDVVAALAVLTRLLPSRDAVRDQVNLRRTSLAGLELTHADFSRFHLENADLSGADLRGANLGGVNFRGADLRGALLSGANFSGASLRHADLTGAILSDDEFGPADLSRAGNLAANQLLHIRYQPNRPPRLPAGLHAPLQTTAIAV